MLKKHPQRRIPSLRWRPAEAGRGRGRAAYAPTTSPDFNTCLFLCAAAAVHRGETVNDELSFALAILHKDVRKLRGDKQVASLPHGRNTELYNYLLHNYIIPGRLPALWRRSLTSDSSAVKPIKRFEY